MTAIPSGHAISFVDTTLRDGHLSLWASNMRTDMMLPIAERLDNAGFEAIEVMSSAFYKKCVRDLKEDPWQRVRLLKQRIRQTPLRSIRSRSMSEDKLRHVLGENARNWFNLKDEDLPVR